MMWIKLHKYTLVTAALSAFAVLVARQWDYDLWEAVGGALTNFDLLRGHEIIFFGFFVVVGYVMDVHHRRKRHRLLRTLSEERLQAMKSTMTTVHDIVNNALNTLQIFRLEAQQSAALSPDSIRQFDSVIFDTAERLKDIQDSDVFVLNKISEGLVGLRECRRA